MQDIHATKRLVNEADLRLLHNAYKDFSNTYSDILPNYVTFLNSVRAKLYPVGSADYRTVIFDDRLFFDVDLGDRLGCDFYFGVYSEYIDALLFNQMINQNSVIFDVGANFGFYSVFSAAKKRFNGVVYAFEPNKEIFNVLKKNVTANALSNKIILSKCALGDYSGKADFYLAEESSFSGLCDTKRSKINKKSSVEITTLDFFVTKNTLKSIDLIKIDVEGSEGMVLKGAIDTIGKNKGICVQVEISGKNFNEERLLRLRESFRHLKEIGFVGWRFNLHICQFVKEEDLSDIPINALTGNLFLVQGGSDTETKLKICAEHLLSTGEQMSLPVRLSKENYFARGFQENGIFINAAQKLLSASALPSSWNIPKNKEKPAREKKLSIGYIKQMAKFLRDKTIHILKQCKEPTDLVRSYISNGSVPWSPGYKQYRYNMLKKMPTDQALLDIFARGEPLPQGYGVGIDERIVEYPWLLSRMSNAGGLMLDGGSVLNYPFLLDAPQLLVKQLVILTLAPESTMAKRQNVSYMFGDLRETLFRDEVFDLIVSISTLEHIGMDNAKLYTQDDLHNESQLDDYLKVIKEFRRILKPGGRFLMTVPFGLAQNLGWLHQFDSHGLKKAVSAFGSDLQDATFYKYGPEGWMLSDEDACAGCEYYDVHSATAPAPDLAAAARAVACLEFVKHA